MCCLQLTGITPRAAEAQSLQAHPSERELPATTPDSELQTGIILNREGRFAEALPHLKKSYQRASDAYAAAFNLALAYLGVGDYSECIQALEAVHQDTRNTAAINNLLAQAYVGMGNAGAAYAALEEASKQTPRDEKLYAYVADACTDHSQYELGIQVADLGLKQLPDSARLHYERAMFLARLDRLPEGKMEFEEAAVLEPGSDVSYLSQVQEALYDDNFEQARRVAREAMRNGHRDYQMQALLGSILLRQGAVAGTAEFAEAQALLEASVAANATYSTSQLALGNVYLAEARYRDAANHLQIAAHLEPLNPAIYMGLAAALRHLGERDKAAQSIATLTKLLQARRLAQ